MSLPLILVLGLFAAPALVYAVTCSDDAAYTENDATICAAASADLTSSGVTAADQVAIITKHNDLKTAETTATNMQKAVWDQNLSDFAQALVSQCIFGHETSAQRKLRGDYNQDVGQNLATASYSKTWEDVVILWHSEIENFTYGGDTVGTSQNSNAVGHYTQVVYADAARIGCGQAVCGSKYYFACNYILGNGLGGGSVAMPYEISGSCIDDCETCSDNLCDCSGLYCYNSGTLDLNTCTCSCTAAFTDDSCSTALSCADLDTDPPHPCGSYPSYYCDDYSNVPTDCPKMCCEYNE